MYHLPNIQTVNKFFFFNYQIGKVGQSLINIVYRN